MSHTKVNAMLGKFYSLEESIQKKLIDLLTVLKDGKPLHFMSNGVAVVEVMDGEVEGSPTYHYPNGLDIVDCNVAGFYSMVAPMPVGGAIYTECSRSEEGVFDCDTIYYNNNTRGIECGLAKLAELSANWGRFMSLWVVIEGILPYQLSESGHLSLDTNEFMLSKTQRLYVQAMLECVELGTQYPDSPAKAAEMGFPIV